MRSRVTFPFPSGLAILLLLVFGTAAGGSTATAQPTATAAQDTLVGTVRTVDYRTNVVEVLTGVGFAVWIERVHVAPAMTVMIDGQPHPLADLRRGQVVQVAYRETDEGKVATSLEVVATQGPGGAP